MHHYRLLTILTAAALCAAPPTPHAAELGEPVVKSHIGQQLVADIELLPDEGGVVRAMIAHDDVYRGANIARSPVVDTLNLSVMRRDGRQYLHITSLKPVEAGYLHLYLELAENGKRKIRPATLWLQPEPAVPVRAAAIAQLPAAAVVPAVASAAAPEPVVSKPRQAVARQGPPQPQPDVACQALDYKNAQLSAQIVDLEEKVKALQYAVDMQGTRVPEARQAAARPAAAAAVRSAAAPKQTAWWPAFAGAGVLALGGGGWWARRRWRLRSSAEETVET
ncbi:MAG TPA: hypothetical protein VEB23_07190 [Ramlibacter sp.]|nr:hypothetical protein [Ramlibacter sp.]